MIHAEDNALIERDVVAEAIAAKEKAESLREAAIRQLLKQQEQVQTHLKALGYVASNGDGTKRTLDAAGALNRQSKDRFKDLKLAEIAKILLSENSVLHGSKIEELAKAGGYTGGTANFQNYLPVALKRDGGFENTGGNNWRLKNGSA